MLDLMDALENLGINIVEEATTTPEISSIAFRLNSMEVVDCDLCAA